MTFISRLDAEVMRSVFKPSEEELARSFKGSLMNPLITTSEKFNILKNIESIGINMNKFQAWLNVIT